MNKNFYFLLLVVALIVGAVVMIFYPSEPEIYSSVDNITFKNTKLNESNLVFEDMKATIDMDNRRRLKVAKYHDRTKMKSHVSDANANYVNGDLSLMAKSNMPHTSLAVNNAQGFRRYISDNSSSQAVVNVAGFQQLHINGSNHSSGGVVQVGSIASVAFDDCTHENIEWSNEGPWGHCTDCGGNGTITGDINSDGTIDIDDMEWVPLGDVVIPMLLLAFSYLVIMFIYKK